MNFWPLAVLTVYSSVLSFTFATESDPCSNLLEASQGLIPGLRPYVSRVYPAGTFTESPASPVHNVAEFCRFGADFNTSEASSFQFELWLPSPKDWNGRFAFVGTLGMLGTVNYWEMGVPPTRYGFAVASTNTGNNGTIWDGSFAMNNPESQIDFGYRAVQLSTEFSKMLVQAYYNQPASYSYWMGCSSGGRQGLKQAQDYPNDYDGLLIGAPANWWSRLAGYLTWASRANDPGYTPGEFVPPSFFPKWAQAPNLCKPDASALVCGSPNRSKLVNSTTCISSKQAATLEAIYRDWTSSVDGKLLFPGFLPGSEDDWHVMLSGQPPPYAQDYFSYLVYNHTTLQPTLRLNITELERVTALADTTNPGGYSSVNPNLAPFFNKGGKILHYHGLSDGYIPAGSTLEYYRKVQEYFRSSDITDSYRVFMIPGMTHCAGGTGPDGFGRANQVDDSVGSWLLGGGRSLKFDKKHDALLALMEWVEEGSAPTSLVGAKHVHLV